MLSPRVCAGDSHARLCLTKGSALGEMNTGPLFSAIRARQTYFAVLVVISSDKRMGPHFPPRSLSFKRLYLGNQLQLTGFCTESFHLKDFLYFPLFFL